MNSKRHWMFALILALSNTFLAAQPILYGIGPFGPGDSVNLLRVDPASGAVEPIGDPLDFRSCTGMDFGLAGLFAVCDDLEQGGQALIRIDPQTAQAVRVGSGLNDITDISFRSDGRLFGWQSDRAPGIECFTGSGGRVVRIDTDDGTIVPLGNSGLTECNVDPFTGLAFDGADRLYLLGSQGLWLVDQSTGRVTDLLLPQFATDGVDFHPLDGRMFALGGIEPSLHSIGVSTGDLREVTPLATTLTAMAFSPDSSLIVANVVRQAAGTTEFRSELTMINLSSSTLQPVIEFFDNNGDSRHSLPLAAIDPQGTGHFPLEGSDEGSFNGWALVSWDALAKVQAASEVAFLMQQPLSGEAAANSILPLPSENIVTAVQSAVLPQAHSFTAPGVITPFRESAFAIVNPSASENALVDVQALGADGLPYDANQIQIPPRGRVSLLLFELLIEGKLFAIAPERPTDFAGSVHISSDLPIAVTGLTVLLPEGKWTGLPVEPSAEF